MELTASHLEESLLTRAQGSGARSPRKGCVTGGRVLQYLQEHGRATAGLVSNALGIDESYARKVLRAMAAAGLFEAQLQAQSGTPPLVWYSYTG